MIDIIELAQNESVVLDSTNNTLSLVLLTAADVVIKNQENVEYAHLQAQYEIFTLAINTGVYTATNQSSNAAKILIVREFIY